jgi:hypothetical protein
LSEAAGVLEAGMNRKAMFGAARIDYHEARAIDIETFGRLEVDPACKHSRKKKREPSCEFPIVRQRAGAGTLLEIFKHRLLGSEG